MLYKNCFDKYSIHEVCIVLISTKKQQNQLNIKNQNH